MRILVWIAVWVGFAGMSVPAMGQEFADERTKALRTIESAQDFLAIMLPGNGYMKGGVRSALPNAEQAMRNSDPERKVYSARLHGEATIIDAEPMGQCRSRLLQDYSNVDVEFTIRPYANGAVSERLRLKIWEAAPSGFPEEDGGVTEHGQPDGFYWSEVKSVSAVGGEVRLLFWGNQLDSIIYLRSSELAQRVTDAIDFLRKACDAGQGTGF